VAAFGVSLNASAAEIRVDKVDGRVIRSEPTGLRPSILRASTAWATSIGCVRYETASNMNKTTKTEPLAEIFNLLDLRFCAQASMSFSKISMRDILVPLSKTSGPAVGGVKMRGRIVMEMGLHTADYPSQYRIDV
jgi:hypothetical protein